MARKPSERSDLPARKADNDKRRLEANPAPGTIAMLLACAQYRGSPKHKRNPALFGLEPYNGNRGDATLCDEHANVRPHDMTNIPALLRRGITAGLVGGRVLWSIADNGWIFEARLTNAETHEYHGYPVRPTEAIAVLIYQRFAAWAADQSLPAELAAAQACAKRYGFD